MTQLPERRLNLLTGEWILVSPNRMERPWNGAQDSTLPPPAVRHDPNCYLCPGAVRAGGFVNPIYDGVFVFPNDFPALLDDEAAPMPTDPILTAEPEGGCCRVICYTPDHSRTMAQMTVSEIRSIVDAWTSEFSALSARADISAVTIFENRGTMMGASNPHPHGQIWATRSIPNMLAREDERQLAWLAERGRPLLLDYAEREIAVGARLVLINGGFAAVVPFWASWPYETLIVPRRAVAGLDGLADAERTDLAEILGRLTAGYDRLFDTPCPYSMGFHQRADSGHRYSHFIMHAHFFPPLLRSASIRKFMVGFEMLAMPQRDLTPEIAAARLRAVMPG